MAAADKKSFWKRGNDTKLPGRAQPVAVSSPDTRPRSKTFEEYEKDTNDAWDEEADDISQLSSPAARLDFNHSDEFDVRFPGKKPNSNPLKSRLKDAVKPRAYTTGTGGVGGGGGGGAGGGGKGHGTDNTSRQRAQTTQDSNVPQRSSMSPPRMDLDDPYDIPDRETIKLQKFGKLLAGPTTDLDQLRQLSWSGIPSSVRATTWQLLCGYLPVNIDRREDTLKRKRQEYQKLIDQYYHMITDPVHKDTFRQIHIDVPRMNPSIPLFQQSLVQECFERILFIWSMRHPASGYVQGINDLVTPFFIVYLSYYISGDKKAEKYDLSTLPESTLKMIEADSFWCLQKLLEGIQDNYTLAQPGIQTKVHTLKDIVKRIDSPLHTHLESNSIDYLQFAFRWMNNLLMREFSLHSVIRLWDSYLSEPDGFATLHVYVCAALLSKFSADIRSKKDFQEIMLFLQNLPTSKWRDDDVQLLLAEAFKLKYMYADAPGHLQAHTH